MALVHLTVQLSRDSKNACISICMRVKCSFFLSLLLTFLFTLSLIIFFLLPFSYSVLLAVYFILSPPYYQFPSFISLSGI